MQTVTVKVNDFGRYSVSEMQEKLEIYARSLVVTENSTSNPVTRLFGCLDNSSLSLEQIRNERLKRQ